MKKALMLIATVTALLFPCTMTAEASSTPAPVAVTAQEITPRADVIVPYYREYNNRLQVRFWNQTRGYWMGDWEYVKTV